MSEQDFDVIQRILGGQKRAYSELVERHKDKAMALAMRMLKNRHDAEEALQDSFIRAFNALPRFEWKSSFSTWFYRIVFNVCATNLSKKKEEFSVSLEEDENNPLELPSDEALPDAAYESNEFQDIVHAEIEKLPPAYASILTLFLVQDMSYDEIVEVAGVPLGTVKNRLFRARTMLRDAVTEKMKETAVRKEKVA
ncbi:MAG: sigma-70 family RNA polymerase sigma factor [Bacteroidota bacterium]